MAQLHRRGAIAAPLLVRCTRLLGLGALHYAEGETSIKCTSLLMADTAREQDARSSMAGKPSDGRFRGPMYTAVAYSRHW